MSLSVVDQLRAHFLTVSEYGHSQATKDAKIDKTFIPSVRYKIACNVTILSTLHVQYIDHTL